MCRGAASHLRLEISLGLLLAPQVVCRCLLLARQPLLECASLLAPRAAPLLHLDLVVHVHMCIRCICSAYAVHIQYTRSAYSSTS